MLGGSLGLPSQAAAALAFEWTVPDRLRDVNGDGRVDPANFAAAAERTRAVRLRVTGAGECDDRLEWTLQGEDQEPTPLGRCQFELELADADPHELELRLGDERVTEVVQARDALVVSIGDSIASGEGNPDKLGPKWLEPRCHRSMQSGAARAAIALERGDRHSAVTFVALGCSGATIEKGLRNPYAGVAPNGRSLPAQVAELRALDRLRPVDAVVLSVGANDIHFAPLVEFCIVHSNCRDRRFDPEHPVSKGGEFSAREVEAAAIAALGPMYDRLAADLRRIVPPRKVAVLEYFDPLTNAKGEPCPGALGGIEPGEVEWARDEVLDPLNATVRQAAAEHGWALVGGVSDAFRTHGVCVHGQGRWVVRPEESLVRQWWITGTLHPNAGGHQASAALIVPKLAAILGRYGGAELPELSAMGGDGGDVPWWLVLVAFVVGGLLGAALHAGIRTVLARVWALLHLRRTSVALAVVGAGLAALAAFVVEPNVARAIVAGLAVLAALLSWLSWAISPPPPTATAVVWRIALVGLVALIVVLAAAALFVGLAVIAGAIAIDRSQPVAPWRIEVGLALLGAGALGVLTWWINWFFRIVLGWRSREPGTPEPTSSEERRRAARTRWLRRGASLAVALLIFVSAVWDLRQGAPPREDPEIKIREQARRAGLGRYDLVLVVDPADRASRQLIRAARRHRRAGKPLFPLEPQAISYDTAFGIAVARPAAGRRRLWRLAEPPTTNQRELVDTLARVRLRRVPSATGSYGRLLADALDRNRVGWRPGAQRGVVFVLAHLPSRRELDRHVRRSGSAGVIPRWASPTSACADFVSHRLQPHISAHPWVPVAWGDALAQNCRRRERYRAWQREGRDPDEIPREPVALHVVTTQTRTSAAIDWWTWARALDGAFDRPHLTPDRRSVWRTNAESVLSDAAQMQTGQPFGRLANVVRWYRPHLLFDSNEDLRPVDVDWFLSPGSEGSRHRICDRTGGGDENCEEISGARDMVGQLDEFLDLRGDVRLFQEPPERQRMYVHTRLSGDRLFLGYWWFFPTNVSPWRPELTCLPGFTFKDATCFDHEADWEGVTVELRVRKRAMLPDQYRLSNLTPEAVIYDFHGTSVRWPWGRIDLRADPGSYATHPVVYVAKGSHASYPAGCATRECNQGLGNKGLGEGRFDGDRDWRYNADDECYPSGTTARGEPIEPCLLGLPTTRDGRFGVLWNAFQGRWGAAECRWLPDACVQTDGPASPARQERFRAPRETRPGRADRLRSFRAKYPDRRTDSPRWPPDPWPPVGRGPTTPAIAPVPLG